MFRAEILVAFLLRNEQQVADDMRPAIHHQVFRCKPARHQRVEILHPVLVPAWLQALRPVRISRPVVANIDRRWRALEHVKLLGAFPDMRHALHRRRARPDNADALALQAGQPACIGTAGIVIVPAAGMEAVPLETLDARNAR